MKGTRLRVGLALAVMGVACWGLACKTLSAGGGGQNVAKTSKMIDVKGENAPQFALQDTKGATHTLAQYKNKVVLINFWATWCAPCQKEFPHFQNFLKKYNAKGFEVLAISIDDARQKNDVGPTIYRYGYTFKVLLDSEKRVIGLFNPKQHVPYSVLIDRKGQLRWRHQGYHPGDEVAMEKKIQSLLGEK